MPDKVSTPTPAGVGKGRRFFPLDIVRVLACYLVIQQHASEFYYIGEGGAVVTGDNTFWIGIITSLCRISVPLFVMLSGFLLLPMSDAISMFFRKRFTRVAYPFVVWCVLYAVYFVCMRGDGVQQMMVNILHIPVNFGTEVGHLWYIYMLIGLYLLVPVISPWLKQASKRELQGYLCLWLFTTLLPYIHLIYPEVLGECYWNETPLLYYFSGFVGYLILGHYLKRYGFPSAMLSWVLLLVGYGITAYVFCSRIELVPMVQQLELSWQFCAVNVALMSVGFFSLVARLQVKGESAVGRLISDVSAKSYGMYLAHIMLLNLFYQLLKDVSPFTYVTVPLIAVCTFVSVYVLIRVLAYLPKSKYIVG